MNYTIEIVDIYDRDFLTYEIWDNNNHIAEVYKEDEEIKLNIFCKDEEIKLNFVKFLKILQKINSDISNEIKER